jgi:hypothetical protein
MFSHAHASVEPYLLKHGSSAFRNHGRRQQN